MAEKEFGTIGIARRLVKTKKAEGCVLGPAAPASGLGRKDAGQEKPPATE